MVAQKYKRCFAFWWIGFVILVLGIICVASYHAIFQAILEVKLPITKDSISFASWKDTPTPLYFKAYFFNVTNPDEVINTKAVPILEEIGPYTFRLYWNKTNIVFNNNDTVAFRENSRYIFLRDKSNGSLDDNITTINAPLVIAGSLLKNEPMWKRVAFSVAIQVFREKFFLRRSIQQLLFDGYYDPVTAIGRTFIPSLPDNKGYFSWFYGKNNSNDGLFLVNTGQSSMRKFNVIERWNGEKKLDFWSAQSCNMINGSNAELSPPVLPEQETFNFFRTDLCRSWTLTFDRTVDHLGLPARHFSAYSEIFANSSVNPDNYCFERDGQMPSGISDISPCQYGAPIFLSLPHFYQADPILREKVDGLSPDDSKHSFYLDVEPISGVTLTLAARTQVNIHLQQIKGVSQFNDIPDIILPVLWQEIVGAMPQAETDILRHQLMFPLFVMSLISFILIGIGAFVALFAAFAALYIHFYKHDQTTESLIDPDDQKQPIVPKIEDDN